MMGRLKGSSRYCFEKFRYSEQGVGVLVVVGLGVTRISGMG